jgi:hypothetical protein
MAKTPVTRPQRPPADLDQILATIALHAGNTESASKALKAAGHKGVYGRRLRDLKTRYSERYAEIVRLHREQLEAHGAASTRTIIGRLEQIEHEAADAVLEHIRSRKSRDPAGDLRNVTVAKGVNQTNLRALEGQPTYTVRHEHTTADEALAWADEQGWVRHVPDIDSTAIELDDDPPELTPAA